MKLQDFKKIFKKGFKKNKIYYKDAEKGKSELKCFKCGEQAGLAKTEDKKGSLIKCTNGHTENLINYTLDYIKMEHDLLECKLDYKDTCTIKDNDNK